MAKNHSVTVKDAVYKLQLSLLEGIKIEDQLFAAGSIISRSDYEDVVVERSITNLCGYPLCPNTLPSDRPPKGRYRISLKEHKVYDLHETYVYCSSDCLVRSRAFVASLQEERCSILNPAKLSEILRSFDGLSLDSEDLGETEEFGLSKLTIQEKPETSSGNVGIEEWIGPSNAIEGYVPQRDRYPKPSLKTHKQGSKAACTEPISKQDSFFDDMDFMSTIITNDEYSVSKAPSALTSPAPKTKFEKQTGKEIHEGPSSQLSSSRKQDSVKTSRKSKVGKSIKVTEQQIANPNLPSSSNYAAEAEEISQAMKAVNLTESIAKSSLKSSGTKRSNRTVTWADEKVGNHGSGNLCEVMEMKQVNRSHEIQESLNVGNNNNTLRFESAEACALALGQASEAVASGDADVNDAISEAGVIILPPPHDLDGGDDVETNDMLERESTSLKWPSKPGIPRSDLFDPEDSWYDAPPEGFSFTLSPFATMWMALFAWVTSSSLAFIYGRDASESEDYLSVNGREYPHKIVLGDGHSSEIRLTAESCLARAFPGLVSNLRLPLPVSTLEQGVGCLLDTMSFTDALPAFRMKQWQVIAFLFIEALSVCRIPTIASYMTNRRPMLHQVLDGAHISAEEYDVMKDLMIPLGRDPRARSGA